MTFSCTNLAEHYIDTGDTKPFKMPCHRIPMFKGPIIEQEIKKMLEQDVIEPSTSPWNSPICLVSKKSVVFLTTNFLGAYSDNENESGDSDPSITPVVTLMCLSIGTPKIINFPFVPNGKFIIFRCPKI